MLGLYVYLYKLAQINWEHRAEQFAEVEAESQNYPLFLEHWDPTAVYLKICNTNARPVAL